MHGGIVGRDTHEAKHDLLSVSQYSHFNTDVCQGGGRENPHEEDQKHSGSMPLLDSRHGNQRTGVLMTHRSPIWDDSRAQHHISLSSRLQRERISVSQEYRLKVDITTLLISDDVRVAKNPPETTVVHVAANDHMYRNSRSPKGVLSDVAAKGFPGHTVPQEVQNSKQPHDRMNTNVR